MCLLPHVNECQVLFILVKHDQCQQKSSKLYYESGCWRKDTCSAYDKFPPSKVSSGWVQLERDAARPAFVDLWASMVRKFVGMDYEFESMVLKNVQTDY